MPLRSYLLLIVSLLGSFAGWMAPSGWQTIVCGIVAAGSLAAAFVVAPARIIPDAWRRA